MEKMMKRFWLLAMLSMVSPVMMAQVEQDEPQVQNEQEESVTQKVTLDFATFENGTVEEKKQNDPDKDGNVEVTITVKPDKDYQIKKEDIEVVLTRSSSQTRDEGTEPGFAKALELQGEDPENLTQARDYTFTVPKGFGAWVKEANFTKVTVPSPSPQEPATSGTIGDVSWELTGEEAEAKTLAIAGSGSLSVDGENAPWETYKEQITSITIAAGVTALGDGAFAGCKQLKSIKIENNTELLTLGKDAIPKGVAIDVPGNLLNEYQITDGWKNFTIDSENKKEIVGFSFSDSNNYAPFVSKEAVVVPSVLKAYTITGINESGLVLTPVTTIAADEAVLVFNSKNKDIENFYTVTTTDTESSSENLLKVAPAEGQAVTLGEVYLLYNDVFYFCQAGTIPAGGIYLQTPSTAGTRSFYSLGEGDGTTAIDTLRTVDSEDSAAWYTLDGRRLSTAPAKKGIYILNHRKVVIK